jgi:hypothetical protein
LNPFNREAGDTPAPSDPLEIAIAHRAGAVVWRAVPYFAFRFGERGRRFGLSDGAWVLTLAGLPNDARTAQLSWLAGLLSPRGIPSWLLEVQLAATCRAGRKLAWSGGQGLDDGRRHLADRRRSVLAEASFVEAGDRFARLVGPSRRATGTGRIIASAHADVALGLCPSVSSVVDWLGDPAMFDIAWREAVNVTSTFVAAEVGRP